MHAISNSKALHAGLAVTLISAACGGGDGGAAAACRERCEAVGAANCAGTCSRPDPGGVNLVENNCRSALLGCNDTSCDDRIRCMPNSTLSELSAASFARHSADDGSVQESVQLCNALFADGVTFQRTRYWVRPPGCSLLSLSCSNSAELLDRFFAADGTLCWQRRYTGDSAACPFGTPDGSCTTGATAVSNLGP